MKYFLSLLAVQFSVIARGQALQIEDLIVDPPTGWTTIQEAQNGDVSILGYLKGNVFVGFFGHNASVPLNLNEVVTGTGVAGVKKETIGELSWETIVTQYSAASGTLYVKGFTTELRGKRYFGYARSSGKNEAQEVANEFLNSISAIPVISPPSLTGVGYGGKKYYIGFGDSLQGFMGNEVKYDVQHTHDIFTKSWGGDYIGTKFIGGGPSPLTEKWAEIGKVMTKDDMFVQYSSGHGLESGTGLEYGVGYKEIRDNALKYPAREIIILTMACYSGNLVDSFNAKGHVWKDWLSEGRSLFVMTSSASNQVSVGGPGTDPQEANGPYGSAGSAFGHSLWKALIGKSDGFVDGVKDGFISLGELRKYTVWLTKQFGHTPQVTGTYLPDVIMNRVPPSTIIRDLETEGVSGEELSHLVKNLSETHADL